MKTIRLFLTLLVILPSSFAVADDVPPGIEACTRLIASARFDEAREEISKYRREHPDDPRGVFLLAGLEEDSEKSRALYHEAELLAVGPHVSMPDSSLAAEALFKRAEIVFSAGSMAEATGLYERLVTEYPVSDRYYDAVYRLGIVNLVSGEPQKALEKFRTCIENNPDSPGRALAATGKMECHVALGEWEEVLASAREVLDESDEGSAVTPRILEVMALAWRELGNEKNATWYTGRLLKNYPDSYQAHQVREQGNRIASDLGLSFGDDESGEEDDPSVTGEEAVPAETTGERLRGDTGSSDSGNMRVGLSFSVQAGAFRDRMNARKQYEKLVAAGLTARVELKDVGGTHFYKVLVGNYATRGEAESAVARVSKATGDKANVVITE